MKIYQFVFFFLLVYSCNSRREDGNAYLQQLDKEVSAFYLEPKKINDIYRRELAKYKKSNDDLYLISSVYVQFFADYYKMDGINDKHFPRAYELLKINDGRYEYITIASNFYLALQTEYTSPNQSLSFLNEAIRIDEKTGKRYFLPHIYHAKGKWYYTRKDYAKAIYYFQKALETYKKSDLLYIASMHNNFGMCYDQMNNMPKAISEARKAIDILGAKPQPTHQEQMFLHYVKGSLGLYLYKIKNYPEAETLLLEELEFCKKNGEYSMSITTAERLYNLYSETGETEKKSRIISYLSGIEPKLKNVSDIYKSTEIIKNYYANLNDLKNLKYFSKKLDSLHVVTEQKNKENFNKNSDMLTGYMVKSIDYKYNDEISAYKRNIWIVVTVSILLVIIFIQIILSARNKSRREKIIAQNQKIIFEKNRKILESDIKLYEEKVQNLHLNLHLKTETEKAFLENLKNLKKSKNIDAEEVIKDLQFKINNLLQINKKNYDFMDDSSEENKKFMESLARKFPALTRQELKMCVYFKLNLSSKEISMLENIAEGSARVYKTKIKTKLGLDKNENLNTFIKQLTD